MNIESLRKDMVAAMKAKDKPRKEAISSLVSAVKKAAIDAGCREDIPEDMVDRVILKELKTAKEQIDTCPESRTVHHTWRHNVDGIIAINSPNKVQVVRHFEVWFFR